MQREPELWVQIDPYPGRRLAAGFFWPGHLTRTQRYRPGPAPRVGSLWRAPSPGVEGAIYAYYLGALQKLLRKVRRTMTRERTAGPRGSSMTLQECAA